MKTATMSVDFVVEIPDETDVESLTLDLIPEHVKVHDDNGEIAGAAVKGYTTTWCEEGET